MLHLRPAGSAVDLPSFPLVLTRDQAGLDPTVRFVLGNVAAEAKNAQSTEELAPLVSALVGFLDAAVSRYADLAEERDAGPAELLKPVELAPQFRKLVDFAPDRTIRSCRIEDEREPVVSIVIPVFNKFDLTYNCVKSIIEAGAKVPFEIVVVDDCSRDETMLAGFAFGRGIRLVRSEVNGGFVRSCNRGFDAARGEYVVFLNNDTTVKQGLARRAVRDDAAATRGSASPARSCCIRTAPCRNAAASSGGSATAGIGAAARRRTIRATAICATPITSRARR